MDKKPTGLSEAFKRNTAPKNFTKNPIKEIGLKCLKKWDILVT